MPKGMTTNEMMAFITALVFFIAAAEWGMRLGCFFAILFGMIGIFVGFVVGFVWSDALDKFSRFTELAKKPWLRVVIFICVLVVMMGLYFGLLFVTGYPMRLRHRSHSSVTNRYCVATGARHSTIGLRPITAGGGCTT
jgi:hypothetical protein